MDLSSKSASSVSAASRSSTATLSQLSEEIAKASQFLQHRAKRTQRVRKLSHHYQLKTLIGEGAFSVVYLTSDLEACKIVPLKMPYHTKTQEHERHWMHLQNEISIHETLNHPNIVKFHRAIQGKLNLYVFLDYCSGGTLQCEFRRLGSFSESVTAIYLHQLIQALKYLHLERGIVHRDLKLANIFLSHDKNHIRLADFGLALELSELDDNLRSGVSGTPNYLAPEVVREAQYSISADIWSFGVILFLMLCGRVPFKGRTTDQTYEKIECGEFSFKPSEEERLSLESQDLIQIILQVDPLARPSWDTIERHAFFHR